MRGPRRPIFRPAPPDRHGMARLLSAAAPPPAHAWRSAWEDVLAEERSGRSRTGLGWVLTQLASGALPSLDVLEAGCERLRLHRLAYAPGATGPELVRPAESSWTELAPVSAVLSRERPSRLFLLAGGAPGTAARIGPALRNSLAAFTRTGHRDTAEPLVVGRGGPVARRAPQHSGSTQPRTTDGPAAVR
ncbi:hypothetical protein ACF09J_19365 [Streptomyces sp. NPDC014889]|uniref:hypothetical protein n=1 Tax=Streptomyces sp. NPDC014889 TaxID=3364928 RepID=UPI0036FF5AC9